LKNSLRKKKKKKKDKGQKLEEEKVGRCEDGPESLMPPFSGIPQEDSDCEAQQPGLQEIPPLILMVLKFEQYWGKELE
jgi:hypothetical protein